ncbi:hypothetical protein [Undibacterium sp. YM2]|uniref:hypothetical protein n=1 Tax=Undibacterium sp. YM2 TaxID=2058625 RepID=UPI00138A6620|nr:hypothetical protein [Undibacterium sp. YM2]
MELNKLQSIFSTTLKLVMPDLIRHPVSLDPGFKLADDLSKTMRSFSFPNTCTTLQRKPLDARSRLTAVQNNVLDKQ